MNRSVLIRFLLFSHIECYYDWISIVNIFLHRPEQFDVMVATNLYGSIVTNVVCGIVGGAGLLSGRNYGDHYAVFEPGTRNTGTAIAGQNKANPIAMLNASVDLLNHLDLKPYANMISDAIYKTTVDDQIRTMGGWSIMMWRD